MTLEEIKRRQLANQHLLQPADKITVVQTLCGLQAQFMVNAIHALKIRCAGLDMETLQDGLVKNWTIQDTVHVFAENNFIKNLIKCLVVKCSVLLLQGP